MLEEPIQKEKKELIQLLGKLRQQAGQYQQAVNQLLVEINRAEGGLVTVNKLEAANKEPREVVKLPKKPNDKKS